MAITARRSTGGGSAFTPMEDGVHQAVITEVREVGILNGQYGPKYTVAVEFVNAAGEHAGRLYSGNADDKVLSLGEKSNLYKDLKALLGEVPEEIGDIEELLVGKQAQVIVQQYTRKTEKGEFQNARVTSVVKAAKGQNVVPPAPETTAAPAAAKAAPKKKGAAAPADGTGINDEDIPY